MIIVIVRPEICLRRCGITIVDLNCSYSSAEGDGRENHVQRMTVGITCGFIFAAPASDVSTGRAAVKEQFEFPGNVAPFGDRKT